MKCDIDYCEDDAEYGVELGSVWGRYCRRHVLEVIDSEFDCRVVVGTEVPE